MPILKVNDNGTWVSVSKGIKGDPGKSAYEAAVEGGFTGTEEAFNEKMFSDSAAQIYAQGDEPSDAPVNSLWLDMDDTGENVTITPEMIGAAPSGYGLGVGNYDDGTKLTTLAEVDAAVKNGWYQFDQISGDIYLNGVSHCGIRVENTRYHVMQTAYVSALGAPMFMRIKKENVWMPWEWINPPMDVGVEYRTTERRNNKVVYKKMIDIGALPNNAVKTVAHGCDTSGANIEVAGFASQNGADEETFPFIRSGEIAAYCYWNEANLMIKSVADNSAYTARFILTYTKD